MVYPPEESKEYGKNRVRGYGFGNQGFICDLNDGEYHEYINEDEQKANGDIIAALRNLAPEMLQVLECFQEGDAKEIRILNGMLSNEVLRRLEKAAKLMEKVEG